MSAIEEGLLRALARGNASDPAFRRAVHAAARDALDKLIAASTATAHQAKAYRDQLEKVISASEAQWRSPDTAPVKPAPPPATPSAGTRPGERTAARPIAPVGRSVASAPRPEGSKPALAAAPMGKRSAARSGASKSARAPKVSGRSASARMAVAAIGFSAVAVVVFLSASALKASLSSPGRVGQEGAAWITVLDGGEIDQVSTEGGARAEQHGTGENEALRIAPSKAGTGDVVIGFGEGVLDGVAGQGVTVELTAGSPNEAGRRLKVSCRFGVSSPCGERTFELDALRRSVAFDFDVPSDPDAEASLVLQPQAGAGEDDLLLYAVRVRPRQP
ncbi:hypothetical protein [Consotaella salsifontis]|uniref:Uncharacterized protein n=1 Tax=Consotaella salsifontis TaxID=1365950 RepID=A0A1T4MKQ5_9HYPH|nr:hypothetical protein [Consotaella salsifontis]SJZ67609.1 hypothetical protein SAMN05428963_102171 [Consotaella salsifontis]